MNDDTLPPPEEDVEGDTDSVTMMPPKMSINVRSNDAIQMVVSKTCLEVLTNLGKVIHVIFTKGHNQGNTCYIYQGR